MQSILRAIRSEWISKKVLIYPQDYKFSSWADYNTISKNIGKKIDLMAYQELFLNSWGKWDDKPLNSYFTKEILDKAKASPRQHYLTPMPILPSPKFALLGKV